MPYIQNLPQELQGLEFRGIYTIMPDFNIDPNFSVYHLVKRSREDTSTLNHRRTMTIISHEIENATLLDGAETVIFSGFQRLSKFKRQIKRYEQMAKRAKAVYVFGVDDETMPPIENITYVPLKKSDQLVKEWFLVSFGRDYFSALATEELTDIDDPDDERMFKGIWTFEEALVSILYEWLSGIVDRRPAMQPDMGHDYKHQVVMLSNTIGRMTVRTKRQKEEQAVLHELQAMVDQSLYPTLKHMETQGS